MPICWSGRQRETTHHQRLLETILEESGYTDALRLDKTPTAQTRLENLKELVQSMGEFDNLSSYLEHVALVMDLEGRAKGDDKGGKDGLAEGCGRFHLWLHAVSGSRPLGSTSRSRGDTAALIPDRAASLSWQSRCHEALAL